MERESGTWVSWAGTGLGESATSTRRVISSVSNGSAASSASTTAARTRSGSITATGGEGLRGAARGGRRCGFLLSEQAADLGGNQRSLERLPENAVGAGVTGFLFIERVGFPGGQDDGDAAGPLIAFEPRADLEAGDVGQCGVHHHQIGLEVVEADQRGFTAGDRDDFEAFLLQDALAHPLRVRAAIGK